MKIPKSTRDRVAERVKNIAHLCASSGLRRANQGSMISKAVATDIILCMMCSVQRRHNSICEVVKSQDGKSRCADTRWTGANHTSETKAANTLLE